MSLPRRRMLRAAAFIIEVTIVSALVAAGAVSFIWTLIRLIVPA